MAGRVRVGEISDGEGNHLRRSGPNEMITLNALRALQAAGRLTPPGTRT
ncbi:MAG TPA: hypothetical protein VIY52_25485 [Streptosporangiaceae bacterium]